MKTNFPHGPRPRFRPGHWLAAAALTVFAAAGGARAATDYYLKLDGIPGETATGPYAGWTRLLSVGAGANLLPPIPPATVPGPAEFRCSVRKALDKTTPILFERIIDQEVIPRLTLSVVEDGSQTLRITLLNVRVSSASHSGGAEAPAEEVSFNYQKIEWSSTDRGGGGAGKTATHDPATGLGGTKPRRPFRATLERHATDPAKLLLTCPVEGGHTYQVRATSRLDGPWETLGQFTAPEDGTAEQVLPFTGSPLFFRVEALD